jgi:predicted ATPase with chaperone activity
MEFSSAALHAPHSRSPRLVPFGDGLAPRSPETIDETDIEPQLVSDLALKLASTTYSATTEWVAARLHLPAHLVEEILKGLAANRMLEVLGQVTPFSHRYTISKRGSEQAARLLEVSGYIGPAPVSLEAYAAMLESQVASFPQLEPQEVAYALSDLVLDEEAVRVASLAVASGRSLFLHGPPGNGKTSLGRLLAATLRGDLWIPHAIAVESSIIRLHDPLCHQPAGGSEDFLWRYDQRWVRIRRPFVVAGGELTIESLDLSYIPALRCYEAPLHLKANGGMFLIDDFGRQRLRPQELLNRWIVPLEQRMDHLALRTGQQIQVPYSQVLVIATNLDPEEVTDSAFLRRMGYRLRLQAPSPERYASILSAEAARRSLDVGPGLLEHLLERYRAEGTELRACHPRDLLERVEDISRFEGRQTELTTEILDRAWRGYFGA